MKSGNLEKKTIVIKRIEEDKPKRLSIGDKVMIVICSFIFFAYLLHVAFMDDILKLIK